jgi:hypothetical protein
MIHQFLKRTTDWFLSQNYSYDEKTGSVGMFCYVFLSEMHGK